MGLMFFALIAWLPYILMSSLISKFKFIDAKRSSKYSSILTYKELKSNEFWEPLYKGFREDKMSAAFNFMFVIRR